VMIGIFAAALLDLVQRAGFLTLEDVKLFTTPNPL
jgi:hypothetical protein